MWFDSFARSSGALATGGSRSPTPPHPLTPSPFHPVTRSPLHPRAANSRPGAVKSYGAKGQDRLSWQLLVFTNDMWTGGCHVSTRHSREQSDRGFIGSLPTPVTSECRDQARPMALAKSDKGGRIARWICNRSSEALSYQGVIGLNPSFARVLMRLPDGWDECAPMATPSMRKQRRDSWSQ